MNALTNPAHLQMPAIQPGASLLDVFNQYGELIDISNEVYHADRSCVSSTALKALLRSPAHFQHYFKKERKETPSMFYGTAFHTRILEPELFYQTYVTTLVTNKGKKEYKEFAEAAKGYRILTVDQSKGLEMIAENIEGHASARTLLLGGIKEQTLIWQDEETGIWLKIRPDCLNFDADSGVCLDLKCTNDADEYAFVRSCLSYNYDFSAAMYLEGLRTIFQRDFDFAFLAVESDEPHQVALYGAPDEMIQRGRRRFRSALRLLRKSLDSGEWPGYQPHGGYEVLNWPKYAQ